MRLQHRVETPLLQSLLVASAALLAASALGTSVSAQTYPTRVIRMVVTFPPGGATDILGRIAAQRLSERLGQPAVVENRVGGGGNIGAEYVAKSAPDGHTLMIGGVPHTIGVSLFAKLGYDFARDLAPVANVAVFPSMIVVHPSLPVKSVRELLALAKSRPGQLNYGGTQASPNHLAMELLNSRGGVNIVLISYKGTGQIVSDLVAGHVQIAAMGFPAALPMVKAGKLRSLAVTSAQRSSLLPDVPTVGESSNSQFKVCNRSVVDFPSG